MHSALGLLWKQKGEGSQEALARLKTILKIPGPGRRDIGHTGILDPFAEGLLLVGIGEGTKLLSSLQGLDKTYEATMCWGITSPSFDTDSDMTISVSDKLQALMDKADLGAAELTAFVKSKAHTQSEQVPPQFSSVRVDGKHAYEWARKGEVKELKARTVRLHDTQVLESPKIQEIAGHKCLTLKVQLEVGSGTYIRALSRDWGMELFGVPGLVTTLKRVGVGPLVNTAIEGENVRTQLGWKTLKITDLHALFDVRHLPFDEAEQLRRSGRHPIFNADNDGRKSKKPQLFVGPESLGAVALKGDSNRVFLTNPFGV